MPCFQSGYKFFEYDEIDSTNLEAKRYAASNSEHLQEIPVFIAKSQTGGRGRLGRSFFSPEETGLYMSVLLPINENLIETDLITPAAGVAVCRTIEELSTETPKIKWVNDVYINKKKVCGILAEGIIDSTLGKISKVVLGIGINLFEPKAGFPEEISNIATSLFGKNVENPESVKYEFVGKLLENLEKTLEAAQEKTVMEEYKARSFLIGEKVTVILGNGHFPALVKDVTEKGHLIVEDLEQGKITQLFSGEVSLKL